MKWNQLKKRVESFFAESVKGRAALRTTRYHKAHDQMGRAWITLDGKEVINMCTFAAEYARWIEAARLQTERGCTDYRNPDQKAGYYGAIDEAEESLRAQGVFDRYDLHHAMFNYLSLPIDKILASSDPITRAIGTLDRRVSARRLAGMDMPNEHSLVQRLCAFRLEAEKNSAAD